ncbi:MAG TPA: hypothetical protein VEM57_00280 [Candidatus Binatus sp.]|nr:hypothetical protein [Candidatus Binatus sp.]
MTRVLAWIGGAVVAFILTGLSVGHWVGPRLDAEAKGYVEQSLPMILGRWNPDDLAAQASPELLQALSPDKRALLYTIGAERLGPLRVVQNVKGGAVVGFWTFPWLFTYGGRFVADVQFEKAVARVSVQTIRRHGEWRYRFLFLSSDAFLPNGKSEVCRYVVPDPPRARLVYLLDLAPSPTVSASELVAFCHDKLHLPAELLAALPGDAVTEEAERHQLVAEDVMTATREQYPELVTTSEAILIVVTDRDMYVRELPWRFAFSARRGDQIAVISTARLNPTFFGARENRPLLWLRTTKVLQRDLAALYYRLPANDDPASLLHGSAPSVDALDHLPCAFSATDLELAGRRAAGTP